jgi:4-diphosphocytidyl-2-C-methyl-D-erythritol kinase
MQEEMRECGALATLMTGSGAAVFGMFASKEPAEACRVRLSGRGYRWDPAVVRTARFTP